MVLFRITFIFTICGEELPNTLTMLHLQRTIHLEAPTSQIQQPTHMSKGNCISIRVFNKPFILQHLQALVIH
jgi:hypothetical protein